MSARSWRTSLSTGARFCGGMLVLFSLLAMIWSIESPSRISCGGRGKICGSVDSLAAAVDWLRSICCHCSTPLLYSNERASSCPGINVRTVFQSTLFTVSSVPHARARESRTDLRSPQLSCPTTSAPILDVGVPRLTSVEIHIAPPEGMLGSVLPRATYR